MQNQKKKFSKVYDKYVGKVYRFVFLKVESQETAEDITSQVFIKTWDRLRSQDPKNPEIKNLTAYIYQIARAEIANHHRAKPKFKIIPAETAQIADIQPSLEQKQQFQADIKGIMQYLSELNDEHQNIVIWRYLDGLSFKKISEIMEKPEATIRVIAHRALKELREKMEKEIM